MNLIGKMKQKLKIWNEIRKNNPTETCLVAAERNPKFHEQEIERIIEKCIEDGKEKSQNWIQNNITETIVEGKFTGEYCIPKMGEPFLFVLTRDPKYLSDPSADKQPPYFLIHKNGINYKIILEKLRYRKDFENFLTKNSPSNCSINKYFINELEMVHENMKKGRVPHEFYQDKYRFPIKIQHLLTHFSYNKNPSTGKRENIMKISKFSSLESEIQRLEYENCGKFCYMNIWDPYTSSTEEGIGIKMNDKMFKLFGDESKIIIEKDGKKIFPRENN